MALHIGDASNLQSSKDQSAFDSVIDLIAIERAALRVQVQSADVHQTLSPFCPENNCILILITGPLLLHYWSPFTPPRWFPFTPLLTPATYIVE
jgi:hypothetical protein